MSRYQVKQIGDYVYIVDAHYDDSPLYRYDSTPQGFEQAETMCNGMNRRADRKAQHEKEEA
ncbi:MAG: hypothetical protein ACM34A_12050 [Bacillota bacterium]